MSPLELVDDRFDKLAEELRVARPVAPEALRERVRALAPPPPRRFELDFRRLVPAGGAVALAGALGVAVVLGVLHSGAHVSQTQLRAAPAKQANHLNQAQTRKIGPVQGSRRDSSGAYTSALAPTVGRLQQYDAFLRVRVRDQDELSRKTQDALRYARRLGGYVVWARYGAPGKRGDSELALRIPTVHVQDAIARFSGYGTLLRQRVVLQDLQNRADSLAGRIRSLRADIASTEEQLAGTLNAAQRLRLEQRLRADRLRLSALRGQRTATVRRARFARVALTMVTDTKPAVAGRFDRTIDKAGSVLGRELEILLYALIVGGPLLAVGGIAILGGRAQRRRADQRLLERT